MESNHVPLDTLSVEFAVLPPHSQVLLFPNPLVVLQLAVHLPLNVLPLLHARAGLQCPASLSRSHFLLLSAGECPHQCLSQRHNATDWQTHSVYIQMFTSVYRYMRLVCKTTWYSDLLIQLLDTVIHYVADGCCSECPTMSYRPTCFIYLYLGWSISILRWQWLHPEINSTVYLTRFTTRPWPKVVLLSTASKVAGILGKATLKPLPPAWNTVWAKHSLQRS